MHQQQVLNQMDRERREVTSDGIARQVVPGVVRWRTSDNKHHWIGYSALAELDADETIRREIAHYRQLGLSCEWKLYAHDQPADLLERLKRAGFEIGPREAVVVFDLHEKAEWIEQIDASCVRRIEHLEQLEDYRRVAEAVFGKKHLFVVEELAQALRTGSNQNVGYVAYDGDQPVSTGRLNTNPQSAFGGLYGGGTLATHRGRGYYKALVAARARDALAAGMPIPAGRCAANQ